ncbi:MAG: hypothetical protein HQK89_16935 [Nitrospirae bacterium]|nr:hypothetical protein [Nitrospirota bacterium]
MSVISIPRVLRDKLGDDASDALVDVINKSESSRSYATTADITRLEGKIDALEIKLEGKMKLYFIILLSGMILSNPRIMDFVGKLLGVIK